MRKVFTDSKQANRSSAYSKAPGFSGQTSRRKHRRAHLQPAEPRPFGAPKKAQAIKVKERFRTYIKTIYHMLYNY